VNAAGLSVPAARLGTVKFDFEAELWVWDARRSETWTFVSVPVDASEEIRAVTGSPSRGFGSVKVRVAIGGSRWSTSIFPSTADGLYVLPVKRAIRAAEGLDVGDRAAVTLEVLGI
jgi:Domain of unknown function (DUF1905)